MHLLAQSFSSLLFPSSCIHCHEELTGSLKLLCSICLPQLELIDPKDRCPVCFADGCICSKLGPRSYKRLGCCFEYEGPQKSLLKALKYQDKPYLAKSLASFMLLQYEQLGWQLPDYITYIPQSFLRANLRGYNQSALLAEHFGKLLQIPVVALLKRTSFSLSQTLMPKEERKLLSPDIFACKTAIAIHHKRILLIDDVFTTGQTVECASHVLQAQEPFSIDVLCLMRTEI
jgi:competence protein ComFC